jgi:hypothetical protein
VLAAVVIIIVVVVRKRNAAHWTPVPTEEHLLGDSVDRISLGAGRR